MHPPPKYRSASALITGPYRYHLQRSWDPKLPALCWIMLNPSTADASEDDPTLRKCVGFSRRLGYGALTIVNLFAWRATDPAAMFAAAKAGHDIVGPQNNRHLLRHARRAQQVICAWGGKAHARERADSVAAKLRRVAELHALRTNADHSPAHPLYVPYAQHPARWQPAARA